jgi:hypothetical protein
MKIFQAYYQDDQKKELSSDLIHLDTRKFNANTPLLEYDIFQRLREHGDFGLVSWKFKIKSNIDFPKEQVHELLKTWDAVIINPFSGIEAVSYNCWQSHVSLIPTVADVVDCQQYMDDIAFCSFIIAKKSWWDKYFTFMDSKLKTLHLDQSAHYSMNSNLSMKPFVIERFLNYCTEGAYLWQYSKQNYIDKFGNDNFYKLKQLKKNKKEWQDKVKKYDYNYTKNDHDYTRIVKLEGAGLSFLINSK